MRKLQMHEESAVQWTLCICEKCRKKSDTILIQIGLTELKMNAYTKHHSHLSPAVLTEQAFPLALAWWQKEKMYIQPLRNTNAPVQGNLCLENPLKWKGDRQTFKNSGELMILLQSKYTTIIVIFTEDRTAAPTLSTHVGNFTRDWVLLTSQGAMMKLCHRQM